MSMSDEDRRGTIAGMTADADSVPPAIPQFAQPLQYFEDRDVGWESTIRIVLIFAILHAAARVLAALPLIAYLVPTAPRVSYPSYNRYLSPMLQAVLSQVIFPAASLISAAIALNRRSRAARLWLVWCSILWIGWFLVGAGLTSMVYLNGRAFSSAIAARGMYLIANYLGQADNALLPALVVVVLTRPAVRSRFDRSLMT
jgi:hypothetical protein